MKAYIIVITVTVLIILLCVSRIHFTFESTDGAILTLRFLFIKFRIYPKKQKKIRLKDYSLKNVKKRKKKSDTGKCRGKRKTSSYKKEKSTHKEGPEIKSFIISCLKTVIRDFPRRVRTERLMLHLTVCGKDAAATALKFCAANQFAALLCSIVDENMPMKNVDKRSIVIVPDYIGEKDVYRVKVSLSIAVGSIFACAGKILVAYVSSIKIK